MKRIKKKIKEFFKKKKFPPKQCVECQSENIYYNKEEDKVFCRDCGAIITQQ